MKKSSALCALVPIDRHDLEKFLPMALMIFCILFNYSVIYALRDSLVMPAIGMEAYSFLEFLIVLPAAFSFTLLYIKLASSMRNPESLFYGICSIFLLFLMVFAWFLYPNWAMITPDPLYIKEMMRQFPHFKWLILIVGEWPYALFTICSELWVNVMLGLLFWQLANKITTTNEAKRFYPLFILIGNLAFVAAGTLLKTMIKTQIMLDFMHHSVIMMVGFGCFAMILYRFVHVRFRKVHRLKSLQKSLKLRQQLSFKESLHVIARSRYLWLMATLVICYGLAINLCQSAWKAKALILYTSPSDYVVLMAGYQQWVGATTIFFMCIGGWMLRRYSWLRCATTPVLVMSVSGLLFFGWGLASEYLGNQFDSNHLLGLAVISGTLGISFSKAAKFALFDPTEEMAYIPLPEPLKSRGKVAVDVLGERIGKSSGAFFQMSSFALFPSMGYADLMPYLMGVFLLAMLIWYYTVHRLNHAYQALLSSSPPSSSSL